MKPSLPVRMPTRPLTLWTLYGVVLLAAISGLTVLSRHALELNREREFVAARESTEQDVRVALWRLDSRLGPYVAAVHDQTTTDRYQVAVGDENDFVLHRFAVVPVPAAKGKSDECEYAYVGRNPFVNDTRQQALAKRVQATTLASAVQKQLPELDGAFLDFPSNIGNNTYVQNYPQQQSRSRIRDYPNRAGAVQQTQQVVNLNSAVLSDPTKSITVAPFWINNELLLVKTVHGSNQHFEGVWLDWEKLKQSLEEDIKDLFPEVDIKPVTDFSPEESRSLAALPAMIVPPEAAIDTSGWSPTHTALSLAWLGLLGAASLAALALNGLISLSERRAAFVSAVTHELRTPLTTFRLYSDLLSRDMVQDPQDRKEYLHTLRREADRLTHLVDNVLRYSRLERSKHGPSLELVNLSQWVQRITPRMQERLRAADMELVVQQSGDGSWLTDPAALEQVVFNLVDNAAKYAKPEHDRRVHFWVAMQQSQVSLSVTDHGGGVPNELRSTIFKPFAKTVERAAETAAGVGLGLALAKQTVAALGGRLDYESAEDGGARFRLSLPRKATS